MNNSGLQLVYTKGVRGQGSAVRGVVMPGSIEDQFDGMSPRQRFVRGMCGGICCTLVGIFIIAGTWSGTEGSKATGETRRAVPAVATLVGIVWILVCGLYPIYLWYERRGGRDPNGILGARNPQLEHPMYAYPPPPPPAYYPRPQQPYYYG